MTLAVMLCVTSVSHLQLCVCPWVGFAGFQAGSTRCDSAAQFYGVKTSIRVIFCFALFFFLFKFTIIKSCVVLWYLID